MWLFTRTGFYSVVQYDPKKDLEKLSPFKRIAKNKYTHVLVRGRVKEDMEALRSVVPNVKIVDDVVADYKYRAVITRGAWKKFTNQATDDIDYDSHFKEVMRAGDKLQPQARYTAVNAVWTAMIKLQPYGAWEGGKYSATANDYDKNWDTEAWWSEQLRKDSKWSQPEGLLDALVAEANGEAKEDEAVAPDDDSELGLDDVKAYILEDKYPEYLTEKELARCTPEGFALWVLVCETRKKLGTSNFNLDEDLLNALAEQAKEDAAEYADPDETKAAPKA